MELSSAVIPLTLAHPGIQQFEDGFFYSLWGVGAWEILAKLLAGQGDVIPFRLFLLHHNLEHSMGMRYTSPTVSGFSFGIVLTSFPKIGIEKGRSNEERPFSKPVFDCSSIFE